jgi:hypothetical protein
MLTYTEKIFATQTLANKHINRKHIGLKLHSKTGRIFKI